MEFKKSINTDSLKKSKHQFVMGIYNARAIAGFLNITIKHIYVYSAYRRDTLTGDMLVALRGANINPEVLTVIKDWLKGECRLKIDSTEKIFKHIKIQLDEHGNGNYSLTT